MWSKSGNTFRLQATMTMPTSESGVRIGQWCFIFWAFLGVVLILFFNCSCFVDVLILKMERYEWNECY